MNRMIALFALVAVAFAEPEADPQWMIASPYFSAHAKSAGLVKHFNGAVTPDETASVKAAKLQHLSTKFGALPYMAGYTGYTMPYTYAASPYVFRGKRDADSEPEAEADPQFLYSNYWNTGLYPYMSSYAAVPAIASAPLVKKTELKAIKPATVAAKYVAPALSYSAPLTYATGFPYMNTFAAPYTTFAHTIAKREADSDPEAQYFANYYSGFPSTYSNYYNRGFYNYAAPYRYASSAYRYFY